MNRSAAEILREYGPFPGVDSVNGVTYDGQQVWFAAGDKLNAFDPASGKMLRSIDVAAHAGTAFDGQHLFQIAEGRIQKIDPKTGRVLAHDPGARRRWSTLGSRGPKGRSGWGSIGTGRSIKSIPKQGRFFAPSSRNRFVTGVTWVDGELWHGTWEGDESDLRRVDPRTGEVLERLEMPPGARRVGARVRWRRSVLLRRRKQREGENRPPAQARLRGGKRLRDSRRPHEQVIEAALTGQVRRSLARRARAYKERYHIIATLVSSVLY